MKGVLRFFNDSLSRILGYPQDELMGLSNIRYMSGETANQVYQTFNEIYRTGRPASAFNWELIRKDGERRIVETSACLILGPGHVPVGFRGIVRDITERKKAEAALRASEEKYRSILQSVEEGYYEVTLSGDMVYLNEPMARIMGYTAEEITGMNNRRYMSEETARAVFRVFNQVYQTGQPTKAFGWELIRKDGQRKQVETSVSLIRDQDGNPVGFRGIVRDISELKAVEKVRERVVNHLSHELGTPISILEAVLTLIPRRLEKDHVASVEGLILRGRRGLERLKEVHARIQDIVDQRPGGGKDSVLRLIGTAISLAEEMQENAEGSSPERLLQEVIRRLESVGRIDEIRRERIVLEDFLRELVAEAALLLQPRRVDLIERYERGIALDMDRTVLKKVCGGLLRNAIENTPDEGRV